MQSHEVHWLQEIFTRVITKGHRQITILQSLPMPSQVLISILGTIMIPFILALTFPILLTLAFAIPGTFLCIRWLSMFVTEDSEIGVVDMKIPTFYASDSARKSENIREGFAVFFCMPVVGLVFGGIHCVGWFFNFPSSAEAMLWRVSSAVLTGIAFVFPIFFAFVMGILLNLRPNSDNDSAAVAFSTIILLVYVVSRLLLLVEAFISLRQLTPGMLILVEWTFFIPHI